MKVNKITFSQIQLAWHIQQMTSAYIHAEQHIIKKLADGIDITGASEVDIHPEIPGLLEEVQQVEFMYDAFGNARTVTPKDKLKEKLDALEIQGNKLLEQEKYELFIELKEIYEKYKQEYDRL
jgi:preprotein translocase subunit SecF